MMSEPELGGVTWSETGELVPGHPDGHQSVQAVTFARAEMHAVRAAAKEAGLTAAEFVRQAALAACRIPGVLAVTPQSQSGESTSDEPKTAA